MASHSTPPPGGRDPHLSICELATRWRIAPKTLYNRRVSGSDIPQAVKIGGRLVFRLIDVERYERDHLTTSTSHIPSARQAATMSAPSS